MYTFAILTGLLSWITVRHIPGDPLIALISLGLTALCLTFAMKPDKHTPLARFAGVLMALTLISLFMAAMAYPLVEDEIKALFLVWMMVVAAVVVISALILLVVLLKNTAVVPNTAAQKKWPILAVVIGIWAILLLVNSFYVGEQIRM